MTDNPKRCVYCTRLATTKDHVIPRKFVGGRMGAQNVVAACEPCNQLKADMIPSEMRALSKELALMARKLARIADKTDEIIAQRALQGRKK
mgnify:CR=1 FL=1